MFLHNLQQNRTRLSQSRLNTLTAINLYRFRQQFFANNFAEERWRKAALKNAFALLGKQRFEHAAAFFLLGGALKDALEVR